jgi:ubiquitin-protein ligase
VQPLPESNAIYRSKSSSKLQTLKEQAELGRRKSLPHNSACKKVCRDQGCLTIYTMLLTSLSDLAELEPSKTWKTEFPDPDDILNFILTIEPDEGMYKGGRFHFNFAINQNFPHDPPKVKCTQKIYHPNVDLEGNVCLNILREDWKPVLNLNAVIVGLQVSEMEAGHG